MEEVAKDAHLGLLIRHALAAGGGLALVAVAGEAFVGGHPAGALYGVSSHAMRMATSREARGLTYSAARLGGGGDFLGLLRFAHDGGGRGRRCDDGYSRVSRDADR